MPVSKGGNNEDINLVTSCFECNRGKSDKKLGDISEIQKQYEELEIEIEKLNQVKHLLKIKNNSVKTTAKKISLVEDEIEEYTGSRLNINGKNIVRKLLNKYDLIFIIDTVKEAFSSFYIKGDKSNFEDCFSKLQKFLAVKSKPKIERDALYIRGILRNRISIKKSQYSELRKIIIDYLNVVDFDKVKEIAKKEDTIEELVYFLQKEVDDAL